MFRRRSPGFYVALADAVHPCPRAVFLGDLIGRQRIRLSGVIVVEHLPVNASVPTKEDPVSASHFLFEAHASRHQRLAGATRRIDQRPSWPLWPDRCSGGDQPARQLRPAEQKATVAAIASTGNADATPCQDR